VRGTGYGSEYLLHAFSGLEHGGGAEVDDLEIAVDVVVFEDEVLGLEVAMG
jgi:hypothetical protein